MQFGSLAGYLMQKTTRAAGDGTQQVTILSIGDPVYDADTGRATKPTTAKIVKHAFVGVFTDEERARFGINTEAQKVTVARKDLAATPNADDLVTIGTVNWRITKIIQDMVGASVTMAVVPV